jgi:hypothetical protein
MFAASTKKIKGDWLMKKGMLVFLLVLILGMSTAFAMKQEHKVADYLIKMEILTDPPKVGMNPITVEVKGPSGNTVTDAKVFIEYDMGNKSHGKKAVIAEGMCLATELTCTNETYKGELNFDKPGDWFIYVKTVRSGKAYTATFKTKVMK